MVDGENEMPSKTLHPGQALTVFSAQAVVKNTAVLSDEIDVSNVVGYFALQWEIDSVAGTGTAKFEALPTMNGKDFLNIGTDIATGQTNATGPGSDGKNAASFLIAPCGAMQIQVTETANAEDVVVSAWLIGY